MGVGERGSVLIEGVAGLALTGLALMANLELMRRAGAELLLHHGAFRAVRASLFSANDPRAVARRFWREVLGEEAGRAFSRKVKFSIEARGRERVARVHLKMPSWLSFRYAGGVKRQFEVTRKCRFACSR